MKQLCSPSPVPRSPRTQDGEGASKGEISEGNQSTWKKEATTVPTVTRQCTHLSCDHWHPPESGKRKTIAGCINCDEGAFLHAVKSNKPKNKSKREWKSDKASKVIVRNIEQVGRRIPEHYLTLCQIAEKFHPKEKTKDPRGQISNCGNLQPLNTINSGIIGPSLNDVQTGKLHQRSPFPPTAEQM